MLIYLLVLFVAVAALVAIIVNRKSLMACLVIAGAAFVSCTFFLLLYKNANSFASFGALCRFTIISSAVLILLLLAVTYIGVNMLNLRFLKKKPQKQTDLPFAMDSQTNTDASDDIVPDLIPGTDVRPAPYGIFGRKPIEKPTSVATAPATTSTPVVAADTVQTAEQAQQIPADVVAQQREMLTAAMEKAAKFMQLGRYLLAEQMYCLYIDRCPDTSSRIDVELLMLDCRVKQGDKTHAKARVVELVTKMRAGEYELNAEQKQKLAEAKMAVAGMKD